MMRAVLIVVVCSLFACGERENSMLEGAVVPDYDQVGVDVMPETIFPIHSPYFEYDFKHPIFPSRVDTLYPGEENIQNRVDQLESLGGGTLWLARGQYTSGRIELKSNIHLHLDEGAVLTFKNEVADYLPAVFTRNEGIELWSLGACVYANGASNIAITGKGKLVGPGEGSVRQRTMTHEVIEKVVALDKPVQDRIYDGNSTEFIFPPALIAPINCQKVYIEGLTLERSAFWNIVPTYCDDVIIRGVTIRSQGIPRGDGIDIESSKNVLVEYCTLYTGDDCIAIKAGRGHDGLRVDRPSENIVVRYCLAATGHGGVTIGSETAGMVKNVHVHDCAFDGTDVGIRFKTRRPRGGGGEHMLFERIRMQVKFSALRWDMLGQAIHVGKEADRSYVVEKNALTPKFSDIRLQDIVIDSSETIINMEGLPESRIERVDMSRLDASGKQFLSLRDVGNIRIHSAQIRCENCAIDTLNVRQLALDSVRIMGL